MSLQTLNDILFAVCQKPRDRVMLQKQALGWVPISSKEIYRSVVSVARALESWGIRKGDRVAILSENRPEWTITDFAALSLGAVSVPVYATQTAEQTAFLLNDCGARIIAVSTKNQLEKVLSIRSRTPLEQIVVMDSVDTASAVQMQPLMLGGPADFDPEFDTRSRSIRPDDLATIIYTSGTTGASKGAMLTHGNMASNISCAMEAFGFGTKDEVERVVSAAFSCHGAARGFRATLSRRGAGILSDIARLGQALAEVQPNIFIGVPRVYEKIRQQVILKAVGLSEECDLSLGAFRGARSPRRDSSRNPTASLAWKIADGWFFPESVRAWAGRQKSSFPEALRWAGN